MKPIPLTLDGLSGPLSAVAYGDPARPPMLALHGWLDNAASLAPLAELIENRYIVTLDHAGHGLSAHRPQGSGYHFSDYVLDIACAIASLGWESCDLLGHSLGAGIATLFASASPERVEKLILIDGVGPASANANTAPEQLRKFLDATLKARAKESASPYKFSDWQQLIYARINASPLTPTSAELLVRRGATEDDGHITVNSDRRVKHPSPFYLTEEMIIAFIKAIQSNTLLFLAKDSFVIKRPETKKRIAAFNKISYIECDGQHHLHMDNPAPLAQAINTFLSVS